MKKYIEQLREKPESVRKQIAVFATIFLGVFVLLFWIATLSFGSKQVSTVNQKSIIEPLAVIKENIQNTYVKIKNGTDNLQNSLNDDKLTQTINNQQEIIDNEQPITDNTQPTIDNQQSIPDVSQETTNY